jgi:hypothetical protein
MSTIIHRPSSAFVALLAALGLAWFVIAASPASAASYSQMQNQEQPWFSGPVCLDVDNGSSATGAIAGVEWCSYNAIQQQWTAVPIAGAPGYYQLKNFNSKLCLEVSGGLYADGTQTVQNYCSTYKLNQQWTFVGIGGGWYEVVARHSGKCLTNLGWNAPQYNCDGSSKQHWTKPVVGVG